MYLTICEIHLGFLLHFSYQEILTESKVHDHKIYKSIFRSTYNHRVCVHIYVCMCVMRFRVAAKGMKDRWDYYGKYLFLPTR